jgi:hypothetical protein
MLRHTDFAVVVISNGAAHTSGPDAQYAGRARPARLTSYWVLVPGPDGLKRLEWRWQVVDRCVHATHGDPRVERSSSC